MLREQNSTLMMKGFESRRHRGLKLLTKWTTINNKVIMPSRHQIVTIDLKSSKKSMLPFWDVYKDRCKNTSRPHKYLGNQANFMKFIRKLILRWRSWFKFLRRKEIQVYLTRPSQLSCSTSWASSTRNLKESFVIRTVSWTKLCR